MLALAFFGEGLLFADHLNGNYPLDVHLHTLLLYPIATCCLFTFLAWWNQDSPVLSCLQGIMMITQGFWFWEVGHILYVAKWNQHDHKNSMFSTMALIYFLIGAILMFFLVFGLVCLLKKFIPVSNDTREIQLETLYEEEEEKNQDP